MPGPESVCLGAQPLCVSYAVINPTNTNKNVKCLLFFLFWKPVHFPYRVPMKGQRFTLTT